MTTPNKIPTSSDQAANSQPTAGQPTTAEAPSLDPSGASAVPVAQMLRIGTLLPTRELALTGTHNPDTTITLATRLEQEGVDSLWIGESVTARPRFDTYTMLAAVCTATASATIGTAVLLPSLRNPVSFAHQIASLDQLSEGRLVLGVGAGFPGQATEAEFLTLGADYRRRVSGIESTMEAARSIWAGAADGVPANDATGRYGFQDVTITPPTVTPTGPDTWLATVPLLDLNAAGLSITVGCRIRPSPLCTPKVWQRCEQRQRQRVETQRV